MPSFEVELPPLVNFKVEELTEEQRIQIAKLNAEIAADNVFRALFDLAKAEETILCIAQRYDPAIGDNAQKKDCASFVKRLKDLALYETFGKMAERLKARGC